LQFTSTRAPYYLSKPFIPKMEHQKTLKNGHVQIAHLLHINNELIQQILSFGDDVKVVKPISLQAQIKTILQYALQQY
jgi:predicted DNA-binding transcriptional regulator YafY